MADLVGPVEVAVIAFPKNNFTGEIAPAIADLVKDGIVSVLDLTFVSKDADGNVLTVEVDSLGADDRAAWDDLDGQAGGLLSEDDLLDIGEALDPDTSAAVLVWENTWARRVVTAIMKAGGVLVAHDRLDAPTVNAALDALESA
jgi:uncharacterized membrane protein